MSPLAEAVYDVVSAARQASWSGRADATDWELIEDALELDHDDIDQLVEDGQLDERTAEAYDLVIDADELALQHAVHEAFRS